MQVDNIALLLAFVLIAAATMTSLLCSNRQAAWQPEKHRIAPTVLVEEAYTWFTAAKQEKEPLEALIRTSYGVACLRALQNVQQLEQIKGATLPAAVQGPAGLLAKLETQQATLLAMLRAKGNKKELE